MRARSLCKSHNDPAMVEAAKASAPVLQSEFAFTARVSVAEPIVIGTGPEGLRRYVPITGGTFDGPLLRGRVLSGGGDWQYVRSDGVLVAEARYTLETAEGVLVVITNRGLRHAPPDVMARLTRGERVPPGSYYFRTLAQFEAPVGSACDWVNRAVFAATAEREPDAAVVHFFRIL